MNWFKRLFGGKTGTPKDRVARAEKPIDIESLSAEPNIPGLLAALAHADPKTRLTAKQAIQENREYIKMNGEIQDVIVERLESEDELVSTAVADVLCAHIDIYTPRLVNLLQTGSQSLRYRSAEILGRCKCTDAVSTLIKAVRADPSDDVMEAANWALQQVGGESAERGAQEYRMRRASQQNASFKGTAVTESPHSSQGTMPLASLDSGMMDTGSPGDKEVTLRDISRYRMIAAAESEHVRGSEDDRLAYYVGRIVDLLMTNHGLNSKEAEELLKR